MDILRYELRLEQQDAYTLVVYLDPQMEEFSSELGRLRKNTASVQEQIQLLVREKFPHMKISVAKVMVGTVLVSTIYLGTSIMGAHASSTSGQVQQTTTYDVYLVQPGDTLYGISKKFNVTVDLIKSVNNLTSNSIFVGQQLNLPFYTYTVVPGDTLYSIAKRNNTSPERIRTDNGLTSTTIFVGQKLRIYRTTTPVVTTSPTPAPTEPEQNGTYTAVAGDSLFIIAQKFGTTIDAIRSLNGLTSDHIYIGQVLKVPTNGSTNPNTTEPTTNDQTVTEPSPSQTTISYRVVAGDTLYSIANRFATTVDRIMIQNNLTSTNLYIGQELQITESESVTPPEPTADTVAPSAPVIAQSETITSMNVKNFSITGNAEANSTITLTLRDGSSTPITLETTADNDRRFTAKMDAAGLKDGTITITATATDAAGNTSTEGLSSIKKDTSTAKPTLNVANELNGQTSLSYPVTGTAEPGATVKITISDGFNRAIAKQAIANERGEFHTLLDISSLNDGNMLVSVTAVDRSGNTSDETIRTVTKDTVSANPVIDNKMPVTIENVRNYTIFGLAEPGATVELTISDGIHPIVTATANANDAGEFRTNVDLLSLNDGALTLTSQTIDSFGNKSEVTSTTLTKETSISPPIIESTDVINSQNASNYAIFGYAQPDSSIEITVSDGVHSPIVATATSNPNGEFHVNTDLSSLLDSTIRVTATQTIGSGIKSEVGSIELSKDATAPGAPLLHNNQFINEENQSAYLLTGKGEPNAEIRIRSFNDKDTSAGGLETTVQTDKNGEYRIPIDLSSLQDGDVVFQLSQEDLAGNVSPLTTKTLLKDTTGPTSVTLDSPPTIFSGNVANYLLSGKAEPLITVEMVISDGTIDITKSFTTDATGTFSIPVDLSTLKDGDVTVSFKAKDAAGNLSDIEPITLLKDTTAPETVLSDIGQYVNSQNQHAFSISGTGAADGSSVTVVISDGTTTVTKFTNVVDGRFTENFNLSGFKDGSLRVDLTQTDLAGNTSTIQSTILTKDTVVDDLFVSKNGFSFDSKGSIFTIIGRAEPRATILVRLLNENGDEVQTVTSTADDTGFYSIRVPVTGSVASATVSQRDVAGNSGEAVTFDLYSHTVTAGENLNMIAKRYNTTVDALRSLNNLSGDAIKTGQTLQLPVTASEVVNLGYMYFNTSGYTDLAGQTAHSVNTVSPSYFDINPDGTLKLTPSIDRNFIESMHKQGIRVVPFLSNHWNRSVGRAMLANKELAATQIADAVWRYNLDGINVDIENVTDEDRDDYTEFVRLLREKIPAHKEVSVAVAANPNGWSQGWHGSYDYNNLAKYADYLMIMSYDESYPGGQAGPVASVPWVERSIQYAVNQGVPTDKIVMGISHFGRYWIEGQSYGGFGISNWQVEELVEKYNGEIIWDDRSQTPKAMITIKAGDPKAVIGGTTLAPGTYTIWFDNDESIRGKLALVEQYGLRGVGNWSIGQETEAVWNQFATTLPTTVPVSTAPPSSVEVDQDASDDSVYTVVAGDSLWLIASRTGTTISALKELNQLTSDNLYVGQTLRIPSVVENEEAVPVTDSGMIPGDVVNEPVPTPETGLESGGTPETEPAPETVVSPAPTPAVPQPTIYTVGSGDTLYSIAKKLGTSVTAIKAENGLTSDFLAIGQTLRVPTTAVSQPTIQSYTVVSGDTLYSIAKRFGTSVSEIKTDNGLTSDILSIGQVLRITT
ncbi:LysM peptidoglycan-binding domain-containing protein [Niallia sp. Krafla_26]|uniref:LysM peptidoglycan-binding domain-containing protein n=1 Tax=Niallia sp. Krafla_26 TaxID=3064703 RepID=UPI003D17414F